MKINNPEKRLKQFWGRVDHKHISAIAEHTKGKKVLDMGCGLGTTTHHLHSKGFDCIGIDYEPGTIVHCRQVFPSCTFEVANAEQLPFEDNTFDTIVLRDALHHFFGEADFEKVKKEIKRVAKKDATMIFFDPNVNFLLKTMRKISSHDDEECTYESALSIMEEMGFKTVHKSFNTLYSLPLSGGYVGINFVPNIPVLYSLILASERLGEKIINGIGLGRQLCWRYLVVGQRLA